MKYIKRTIDHCPRCNSSDVEINALNDSVTLSCRKCFYYTVIKYSKKKRKKKSFYIDKEITEEINRYFYDLLSD